jgi:hypothetical protein
MGEILEKMHDMERECMPLWLEGNNLNVEVIEKDLKEFAHWLLTENRN